MVFTATQKSGDRVLHISDMEDYALDFWIHPKFHSRYQTPQTSDSAGSISVYLYTPFFWPLLLETCLPLLPDLKNKPWKSNWPAHGQPKDDGRSYHLGLCQTKRRLLDSASTNHYLIILCFPEASMGLLNWGLLCDYTGLTRQTAFYVRLEDNGLEILICNHLGWWSSVNRFIA